MHKFSIELFPGERAQCTFIILLSVDLCLIFFVSFCIYNTVVCRSVLDFLCEFVHLGLCPLRCLSFSLWSFGSVSATAILTVCIWVCGHLSFSLRAFGSVTVILTACIWFCDHHSHCMHLGLWLSFSLCAFGSVTIISMGKLWLWLFVILTLWIWGDLWPFVILTLWIWVRSVAICYSHFVHLGLWLFVLLFWCI